MQSLAKVNLDLRVLYNRGDGFHELRSVFQSISLADRLAIEYTPAARTVLEMDDALGIPDNLVLRAAKAVLAATKTHARVRFRLDKRIPMGGGLGGGSSNAAAVLLALPVLAGRVIPVSDLADMAAQLGSDVPFFLHGGTALAAGRGNELYGLPEVGGERLLLVASGIHVATGPAYQALRRPLAGELTSGELSRKMNSFQLYVRTLGEVRSARVASALGVNDFESAVFGLHPQLRKMWGKLRQAAATARMTGSGSALFAIYATQAERQLARQSLEGDKMFADCRLIPARLVSGRGYQRLWRRQLAEHLVKPDDLIWPPRSRYAR